MRERLLRLLRVPPRPSLPAEDPDEVRTFRAAPAWLTYRRLKWVLKQAGALTGLLFGLYWLRTIDGFLPSNFSVGLGPIRLGPDALRAIVVLLEASAFAGFVVQAAGSLRRVEQARSGEPEPDALPAWHAGTGSRVAP